MQSKEPLDTSLDALAFQADLLALQAAIAAAEQVPEGQEFARVAVQVRELVREDSRISKKQTL